MRTKESPGKCGTLTPDEMVEFRRVCREEGVRPSEECPLCRSRDVLVVDSGWGGYCDTHLDWGHPTSRTATCGGCERVWLMTHPEHRRTPSRV